MEKKHEGSLRTSSSPKSPGNRAAFTLRSDRIRHAGGNRPANSFWAGDKVSLCCASRRRSQGGVPDLPYTTFLFTVTRSRSRATAPRHGVAAKRGTARHQVPDSVWV